MSQPGPPAAGAADPPPFPDRPASYDAFVVVTRERPLAKALATAAAVYLPPGTHRIDNPLVVDRDGPLFLHGGGRTRTRLLPRHPDRPLLVVRRATRVNLSNLRLEAAVPDGPVDVRALRIENVAPITVELQDLVVNRGTVEMRGPGELRLQATRFHPQGRVVAPLLVDHPDARVTMVGGNISSQGFPHAVPGAEAFHVWAKRGRLRIFTTGVQGALGVADFRIDAASRHGPHVIAGVRSEGANGANKGKVRPGLLYVPPSGEAVDVLIEANSGSWASQGLGSGRLVDYNAAGTLWLIGNNANANAASLAVGKAPRATVVALGNIFLDPARMLPIEAKREIRSGNIYAHRHLRRSREKPHTRLVEPDRNLADQAPVPPVPAIEVPPPLPRPRVNRALPGMLDVKDFGAVGDGAHDDTDAIQAALDAGCDGRTAKALYLPAGAYRLTRTLHFNDRSAACRRHPSGAWIAGAGRERTVLAREPGGGGGVFATEGLAYSTVQGLTFQTAPWGGANGPPEPAFSLENSHIGPASQEVSFYDVRFDGGRQALAIGLTSRANCSENLMVDTEFANAGTGLAIGTFNALANTVYAGRFENNQITMGHVEEAPYSGGTWNVLGATVRGTRDRDFVLRASATGVWYLHGFDSDSPRVLHKGVTAAGYPLVFERSVLAPRDGTGELDFAASGGPIFLHSEVRGVSIHLTGGLGSNYALSLHPRGGSEAAVKRGRYSFVDRLD